MAIQSSSLNAIRRKLAKALTGKAVSGDHYTDRGIGDFVPPKAAAGDLPQKGAAQSVTADDGNMAVTAEEVARVSIMLRDEFRRTKLFWIMWAATDRSHVLPFPTMAVWISKNSAGEFEGYVRSYNRNEPELGAGLAISDHAIVLQLDEWARGGFNVPNLLQPSVDYISDILLDPFWERAFADAEFAEVFICRYHGQKDRELELLLRVMSRAAPAAMGNFVQKAKAGAWRLLAGGQK